MSLGVYSHAILLVKKNEQKRAQESHKGESRTTYHR